METSLLNRIFRLTLMAGLITNAIACSSAGDGFSNVAERFDSLQVEHEKLKEDKALIDMRLARFDSLDFEFYNKQKWESFEISHADDIEVIYPDGKVTKGLAPEHIDMLKPLFAFAPDTKITSHPVRFGSGEYTCVIGEMEGTFSNPMNMAGNSIPSTGKKFKLRMCTVGQWKNGKMVKEYLFWDNQAMMKQIGLGQ
jgi:hypothetical protein